MVLKRSAWTYTAAEIKMAKKRPAAGGESCSARQDSLIFYFAATGSFALFLWNNFLKHETATISPSAIKSKATIS